MHKIYFKNVWLRLRLDTTLKRIKAFWVKLLLFNFYYQDRISPILFYLINYFRMLTSHAHLFVMVQ
jgi:hypothetical protein